MTPGTLNYRNPRTVTRSGDDRLLALMRRREIHATAKLLAMGLGGAAMSLVGPFFAALFTAAILRRAGVDVRFSLCFAIALVTVTPLLYWLERRTCGEFVSDSIAGAGFEGRASSYGEFSMRGHILSWIFWTELALIGPRLLLASLRNHEAFRNVRHASRSRACDVLHVLAGRDEGIEVLALRMPDEPYAELQLALRYLHHHGWVDLSKSADRVWLLSENRKILKAQTC